MDSEDITIELPNGYQLLERPGLKNEVLDKIYYEQRTQVEDNKISFQRVFRIGQERVAQVLYRDLKELYSQVIEHDNAQVVLEKN